MFPTFPQQSPMFASLSTKPKDEVLSVSFLLMACAFVAYVSIFMFTLFPAPLGQFMIQKLRWPILLGVTVVFFMMRRHPVRSLPITLLFFFMTTVISSCMAAGYMFALSKVLAMAFAFMLSFYLVPAALNSTQYRYLIAIVCCVICTFGSASIAAGIASRKIFAFDRYESLYFGINSEGAYMGFTFFAALWMSAEFPKFKLRLIFQFLVPASLVACYATGSRSSFFGLLAGVLFWGATLLVRGQTRRRRQFFIFLFILSVVIVAKRSFFERGWETLMRNSETSEEFFESRMWIWEDSWRAFTERPFLGHGYGVSALVSEEKQVSLKTTVSVRDGSGYLGFLESLGILGCTAFGILVFQLALFELVLLKQRIINPNALTAHGMTAMTGFLLVNHIGEPWLLGPGSPTFHLFWFFMGAAFYFNYLARMDDSSQRKAALHAKLALSRAQWEARQKLALQG